MWPTVCIDNFFDNPDEVVKSAEKKQFPIIGNYPGIRTHLFSKTDPDLHQSLNEKIISIYYPTEYKKLGFESLTGFHKVPSGLKHDGWVHKDEAQLSYIIYLSKDLDIGTSMYKPIKEGTVPIHDNKKHEYFKNKKLNVAKYKKENNNQFVETASFKGIYNRLIVFDSKQYHAAHVNNSGKDRLTILGFVLKLWKK